MLIHYHSPYVKSVLFVVQSCRELFYPYWHILDKLRIWGLNDAVICLDESIVSVDKARKAIALKACRWVNIKLGRVGGLTNALAIHNLCQEAGIPCWVGGMLESAVGQAHS